MNVMLVMLNQNLDVIYCEICPAGTFAAAGSIFCQECPDRTVAPNPGTEVYFSCDKNVDSDNSKTICVCDSGYAAVYANETQTCEICPEGAVCDCRGVEWDNMEAQTGFWGAKQGVYYRCLFEYHCCGGNELTDEMQCCNNRVGPLCAQCKDGYVESVDGICEKCLEASTSQMNTILIAVACVIALIIQFYLLLRAGGPLLLASVREEARIRKASAGYLENPNDYDFDNEQVNIDDFHMRYEGILTINGAPRPKPDFTYKLKILLGFIQILTNLSVGLDIQWPSMFVRFLSYFNFANFNFLQLAGFSCVADTDYCGKLCLGCFTNYFMFLIFIYLLPIFISTKFWW